MMWKQRIFVHYGFVWTATLSSNWAPFASVFANILILKRIYSKLCEGMICRMEIRYLWGTMYKKSLCALLIILHQTWILFLLPQVKITGSILIHNLKMDVGHREQIWQYHWLYRGRTAHPSQNGKSGPGRRRITSGNPNSSQCVPKRPLMFSIDNIHLFAMAPRIGGQCKNDYRPIIGKLFAAFPVGWAILRKWQ